MTEAFETKPSSPGKGRTFAPPRPGDPARTKDYGWRHDLLRGKSKRGLRGRRGGSSVLHIKGRVSIAQRPPHVIAGHWEGDLMMFARYGQAILTLHERCSRLMLAVRLHGRSRQLRSHGLNKAVLA